MPPIVECVANFSEGRRLEIVDEIVASIAAISQVRVLHRSSDPDHNRSVITFAGTPYEILEAAFQGISIAARLINMDRHRGVHPRLGAADVVPFVPIEELTLADCVELARLLGERVGDELKIPVYLYAEAASHPDRHNLANIRRGEYETLKREIRLPQRQPDFGPARVGQAGAVVIGARKPLIAYNVYLNTEDVKIAQQIAKTIRFSSGGLVGVKALGFLVKGKAQVSMNLTDYKRTPVHQVVEMIRREAERHGVGILKSELIGLIPADALFDTAAWYLQLNDFDASRVLENQLWRDFS